MGQEFLRVLHERNFPYSDIKMLASKRSAGKKYTFEGVEYTVEELTEDRCACRPCAVQLGAGCACGGADRGAQAQAAGAELPACVPCKQAQVPRTSTAALPSAAAVRMHDATSRQLPPAPLCAPACPACSFKGWDIALFSAGGSISKKYAPIASAAGCTVSAGAGQQLLVLGSDCGCWAATAGAGQ